MTNEDDTSWSALRPPLSPRSRLAFLAHCRALTRAIKSKEVESAIREIRERFATSTGDVRRADRQVLLGAGLVLADLVTQGWGARIRRAHVEVRPPTTMGGDHIAEKARIRRQELINRDSQLRRAPTQKFLRSMEIPHVHNGKFVSIFSLMRDGRELGERLHTAREHINNGWAGKLADIIDPYLEFVSSRDAVCTSTGMRLMDIWRYFRHTWTNQYRSVPGRTMMFLVRDRACNLHPIIGIGALSSPIMQIRERDIWIGWHPDAFLAHVKAHPAAGLARWLVKVADTAVKEIYIKDFISARIITAHEVAVPTEAAIARLLREGAEQRRIHHRFARSRDYKTKTSETRAPGFWVARARAHLFRSKRALALASHLQARATLRKTLGRRPTANELLALANTTQGAETIRRVVKKAKADRVGIAVADISVCGAIQPYNAILGGKLVAMLAASPEIVLEYKKRYGRAESEIASSMAGRPIRRSPNLVLLGTTSLYGVGSSQYNRVKIPCERLDGLPADTIRYLELGKSEAFGTSHYSEETVKALVDLVQQSSDGRRVNSIFGEGVSPKLRKVRQGLDLLCLPSELFLRHHRPRVVYAVSLIRNLREYLLGIDSKPNYFVTPVSGKAASASISAWWRERWLRNRIASDEVLDEVSRHTLISPISHGARVPEVSRTHQLSLFTDSA